MTIDYSRWDNIDTDSESEDMPSLVPAQVLAPAPVPAPAPAVPQSAAPSTAAPATTAPATAAPATAAPARAAPSTAAPPTAAPARAAPARAAPARAAPARAAPATAAHPATSEPEFILGVIVRCAVEKARLPPWSVTRIQADHPIFRKPIPPIPQLIEVPLVIYRVGTQSADRADLDNQIATYLNIDDETGLAPPSWQANIGTVIVARKDKKPLLLHHLEGVWMYCDRILERFGDGKGAPLQWYNRQAFEAWWMRYCVGQRGYRKGTRGENDPDDWRAVRSPFEM